MKKSPERVEKLAAEYVLGTLRGPARRRFERWMQESLAVRQEVWFWENQLAELAHHVPAKKPPASVWERIQERLWPQAATPSQGSWLGNRLWPLLAGLSSAATVVLATILVVTPISEERPEPVQPTVAALERFTGAVIDHTRERPLWLVSSDRAEQSLRLRPVDAQAAEPGKDYELWVVPQNADPISLGTIPADGEAHRVHLDDATRQELINSRTLAISLEPIGGSPTGQPTGPILHTTQLYEL